MPGFRRLAARIYTENRVIDIEIPFRCEKYIDSWVFPVHLTQLTKFADSHYLVDPVLPLITDPSACQLLSNAALDRNPQAHGNINPSIVPMGTRLEMIDEAPGTKADAIDLVRGMIRGEPGGV
ncbi:uncharacterized protein EDB91DRAFT_458534 [Suillus paluster]|uniref:uncharacterized protein n=1 Tax=Suillus paluster TaxID=48578 RepID=UPI001B86CF69|nr:uncharacterized protein EDB91DRAFT_458534 [Suillus paluster]KAG1738409.1 hypothetical protein EDB91DRAFT_458534 [Suillus paluster]